MSLIGNVVYNRVFKRQPPLKNPGKSNRGAERYMGPNFQDFLDYRRKEKDDFQSIPSEVITITTADGLKLYGDFYENKQKTDKTIICVHGYHSSGKMGYPLVCLKYLDEGFNVLLTNNRASGPSEGEIFTFGVMESKDNVLWVKAITKRYPNGDIIVQGNSLGAASVCMMANKDLPKNVKLLVSDCSYSSIRKEFTYTMKHLMHIPTWPALNIINREFIKNIGQSIDEEYPLKSVSAAKVPMFFVHGEEDRYIPYSNMLDLYAACTSKKAKLLVPNAGHAASFMYGKDDYFNAILNFASHFMTLPKKNKN